jgi:hypothetical protein
MSEETPVRGVAPESREWRDSAFVANRGSANSNRPGSEAGPVPQMLATEETPAEWAATFQLRVIWSADPIRAEGSGARKLDAVGTVAPIAPPPGDGP